jgi:hypothetical protein
MSPVPSDTLVMASRDSNVSNSAAKNSKSSKKILTASRVLKKKAGGYATPAMFRSLETKTAADIAIEHGLKTAVKNKDVVMISGDEWPETEWDTPGAWYPGVVTGSSLEGVHVEFVDKEGPLTLTFTHAELDRYAAKYEAHQQALFDCLIDATEVVDAIDAACASI